MWRKSCSAPPWSHLRTTGKYCPKFKIKGLRLSHKQGRASRAARVEGGRSGHPSTGSRVSHSNPSWPLHTLERWRQPRGRKWPATGPGLAVPKQGPPGHTRPPAGIAHPSPARTRCAPSAVPARRGANSRRPAHRQVPGRAPSLWVTHLAVTPEHSHPHNPWACQPRVGGTQGSLVQQPPGSQAVRRHTSCSAALLLLLWRRPRHVTPPGPPPSTRRPVPRRVPSCQSIPKAQAPSHALPN